MNNKFHCIVGWKTGDFSRPEYNKDPRKNSTKKANITLPLILYKVWPIQKLITLKKDFIFLNIKLFREESSKLRVSKLKPFN